MQILSIFSNVFSSFCVEFVRIEWVWASYNYVWKIFLFWWCFLFWCIQTQNKVLCIFCSIFLKIYLIDIVGSTFANAHKCLNFINDFITLLKFKLSLPLFLTHKNVLRFIFGCINALYDISFTQFISLKTKNDWLITR